MNKSGKYQACPDDELVNIIVEAKKVVPEWVRIMRMQREIESKDIIAGPKSGNLRQIVLKNLRQQGYTCRCIRCRETGLQRRYPLENEVEQIGRAHVELQSRQYLVCRLLLEKKNNYNIQQLDRMNQSID